MITTDKGEYTVVVYDDMTGDGLVNASDISLIIKDFLGTSAVEVPEKRIAGNVFKDDNLDSLDISIMIKSFLRTLKGNILETN